MEKKILQCDESPIEGPIKQNGDLIVEMGWLIYN